MNRNQLIIAVIICFVSAGASSARIYRWVDETGIVHYSDAPTSDEMPNEGSPENLQEADPPSDAPSPPVPRTDVRQQERQELMESISSMLEKSPAASEENKPQVELYVTSWCLYCKKAESFFYSQGIEYTVYDVEKDPAALERMQRLTDYRGVPFAVVNGRQIKGYSEAAYRQALSSR